MSNETTIAGGVGASLAESGDILTAQEAAAFIRVNRRTLYRFVEQKAIPFMRAGRGLRFSRHDLMLWMKGQGQTLVSLVGPSVAREVPFEVPTGRPVSQHDTPDNSRNIMVIAGFPPKRGMSVHKDARPTASVPQHVSSRRATQGR